MQLRIALALLFALSGCQCFIPVDELLEGPPDSGVDARRDAGSVTADGGRDDGGVATDAGLDGGPECRLASDCPWRPPDGGLGLFPCVNSQGMSCIAGRCLFECDSGRTCMPDAGTHCLTCSAPVPSTTCGSRICSAIFTCRMRVIASTCARGPVVGAEYDLRRQPDCGWVVAVPDGGAVVGATWDLSSREAFGTFPGVAGVCVGRDLFAGIPRMEWSCPNGCAFMEMGCD